MPASICCMVFASPPSGNLLQPGVVSFAIQQLHTVAGQPFARCRRSCRPASNSRPCCCRYEAEGASFDSAGTRLGRRALLASSLVWTSVAGGTVAADNAIEAAPAAPLALPLTFTSSEGFSFSYPEGWVVAFDRSGGRGDGAVAAVGDFRQFLVASVFRTTVPDGARALGLDAASGFALCVEPQRAEGSTMRLEEIRSEATADGQYEYEYEIETCRGEIQEGAGGVLRCLAPSGQELATIRRHHLGRAVLVDAGMLTMAAAAPVERWAEAEGVLRAIVGSYRVTPASGERR